MLYIMILLLQDLIERIEASILLANAERGSEGLPEFGQVEIRLLGQFGLLVHPKASSELQPAATRDIDATLRGEWSARWIVRSVINQSGYTYDDLSNEIWLPPEAQFELLHDSQCLKVEVIAPLFNLLSKAVKAPERNRNLIVEGIAVYGDELIALLTAHGVNIDYFFGKDLYGK